MAARAEALVVRQKAEEDIILLAGNEAGQKKMGEWGDRWARLFSCSSLASCRYTDCVGRVWLGNVCVCADFGSMKLKFDYAKNFWYPRRLVNLLGVICDIFDDIKLSKGKKNEE